MPTLKSKIFSSLMRNRHLFKGKFKKEVFDLNTSIEDFREQCEKGAERFAKIPEDVSIQEVNINGINAEWITPKGVNPEKIILYVHGGGYVSGSCNDHRSIVSKFAKQHGVKTLQYEYRLAPEHRFPAGLDDSVAVYNWLLEKGFDPKNIIVAGESAGGGLALALLLALKERNIALPKAAVAISPWTDLTCSGDSYKTKGKVSVAPTDTWVVFSKHYCGDNPADLPLISPQFGDLSGLPPILINSGEDDELFDDGKKFYQKAKEAGVDATFRAGIGQVHCYPLLAPAFKEATDAMNEICDFIKKQLEM
jgi:epsilon-lactone hydrolase